jgi:general secretion pathway protein L
MHRTLPFLIEEQLADDIATMHVVAAPHAPRDPGIAVAAVRRSSMTRWLELLAIARVTPQAMMPDMLALNNRQGQWHVLCDAHTAWVRSGVLSGFAVDASMLTTVLSLQLAQASPSALPQSIEGIVTKDSSPLVQQQLAQFYVENSKVPFDIHMSADTASRTMEQMLATASSFVPINLLQGEFAVSRRHTHGRHARGSWLNIAAMMALLYAMLTAGQTLYYKAEAKVAQHEMLMLYQQLFPNDKKIISPIRQMKAQLSLGNVGNRAGAMPLLGAVAAAWRTTDSGGIPITLDTLDYRDVDPLLRLSITAPALAPITARVERMNAGGLAATLVGVNNTAGAVHAQITITRGQP